MTTELFTQGTINTNNLNSDYSHNTVHKALEERQIYQSTSVLSKICVWVSNWGINFISPEKTWINQTIFKTTQNQDKHLLNILHGHILFFYDTLTNDHLSNLNRF